MQYVHFNFFSVFVQATAQTASTQEAARLPESWIPATCRQKPSVRETGRFAAGGCDIGNVRDEVKSGSRFRTCVSAGDGGGIHDRAPDTQEVVLREPPAD